MTSNDVNYTSQIIDDRGQKYATFAVPITACAICDRPMVIMEELRFLNQHRDMVYYARWGVAAQMRRGGIVMAAVALPDNDDKYACEVCASEHRVSFECSLCHEKRDIELLRAEDSYLNDPVCQVCYETQTAKVYQEHVHNLHESHRYDYE